MDVALSAVQWVVGKALAPVADGVLEAWEASKNLGLNIEALKMELLLVQATLETASRKEIGGQAMEQLLQKLRDSAHSAEDLLDMLDYFRIHDQLHGTYDAADQHAKGGKLACLSSPADPNQEYAREQASCCAWPRVKHRARGNPSFAPDSNQANEEVRGCMPKLGKFFPRSSSPDVVNDGETPRLGFNRVDISQRMKRIVEELQPVRREVTTILQSCGPNTVRAIAQNRPTTTSKSIEPKLYGRDHVVNNIIHDITKGKYCGKDLSVLPIVGLGGIGKTTLIQHIYTNQEVQNHFPVRIWVCVSLSFDLNKLLEEIKRQSPQVDPEEKEGTTEQLIEQRLKSRRFLLVLDDIWGCSNEDDWKRLLLPLKTSQGNGSMIIVTTRSPGIAKMVRTTDHSIELRGLKSEDFRELFHALVFGHKQSRRDQTNLLHTGDMIIEKLKGVPLAAKTVGKLLRKDHNLHHWRRVLENKEWERQIGVDDIMPSLKLSYDYLPFRLQKCFSYSALFPEDYMFSSSQLIDLWIGLNILQPSGRNQTFQDIGLSNLNDLVNYGFFREEETNGCRCYVMHDLLHSLALKVASSNDCISLHRSNASADIPQRILHLSINIDGVDVDANSGEIFEGELTKLKTKLVVEHLQTLMLFGKVNESFAKVFGDLFRDANALRVLHLPQMPSPVDSILDNFSALVHLRYLRLGGHFWSHMHLPLAISGFYHLRILDLRSWHGSCDLPRDISNLAKLCHIYTRNDNLHSDIHNVGKLKVLEELKVFLVNKESQGFEPKQLEHLDELRELGIYNLEKICTKREAAEAKLMKKRYLERLTLDWDSKQAKTDRDVEGVVLEKLQPHKNLRALCIRGHGGASFPTWLGDKLAVDALQSLNLVGVSWEVFPSLGKLWGLREVTLVHIARLKEFIVEESFCRLISLTLIDLGSFERWVPPPDAHHLFPVLQVLIIRDCPKLLELPLSSNHIVCPLDQEWSINCFPKLQELKIDNCPKLLSVTPIPWAETLCSVKIRCVKLLERFEYSKSSDEAKLEIIGKDDLHSLDQVLFFHKETGLEKLTLENCPPLELKHLVMLSSLKTLTAESSNDLFGPLGGQGDAEWQLPVEHLEVRKSCGVSGMVLTELLSHLPSISKFEIVSCQKISQLVVGQTTSVASERSMEQGKEDRVLLFPAHLSDSLQELVISDCPELVLVSPPTLLPDGHNDWTGGLQVLTSLQRLKIEESPKFLSAYSFSPPSCRIFPSSLQDLKLDGVEGMGSLEPISNLASLATLELSNCGEDLRCVGLGPLLTAGGQLKELGLYDSPRFFAGWDPNPKLVLQDEEGTEKQQLQLVCPPSPSTLQELWTDEATGFLATPICRFLSSSLTKLGLYGNKEMECFSKDQEDALHVLSSLQELQFWYFDNLQYLPVGLHKLTNLKKLKVWSCPTVRSLPKDSLPKSLQELDVSCCGNEELKQQWRGLVGSIPKIIL